MTISTPSPSRRASIISAFAVLGCALAFALAQAPSASAADYTAALKPLDDKAPSLPLAATFAKADPDTGPFVLNLKNTSDGALKVTAKILLSVYFHADSKSRNLPEHTIDPGQVWTIPGLAANDKVVVSAAGYAPLELTVQ
jgi:hypothetical protein